MRRRFLIGVVTALAVGPEGALAQRPPDKIGHRVSLTDLHCESQTGKRSLWGRGARQSWSSLAVRS